MVEGGAMGNVGGVIIYIMENKKLLGYKTSLFNENNVYSKVQEIILKYQDKFKTNTIKVEKVLFEYHYGGMGNNVLINKKITLEKEESFFRFNFKNDSYKIFCSVQGVFMYLAYPIDHSKNY